MAVTAQTDNSVLTLQSYMDSTNYSAALISRVGKPPSLLPPSPPLVVAREPMSRMQLAASRTDALKWYSAPNRTHDERIAFMLSIARSVSLVLAYISSALMVLPVVVGAHDPEPGAAFPLIFTQNKGRFAFDLLSLMSGKTARFPTTMAQSVPDEIASNSGSAALRHKV